MSEQTCFNVHAVVTGCALRPASVRTAPPACCLLRLRDVTRHVKTPSFNAHVSSVPMPQLVWPGRQLAAMGHEQTFPETFGAHATLCVRYERLQSCVAAAIGVIYGGVAGSQTTGFGHESFGRVSRSDLDHERAAEALGLLELAVAGSFPSALAIAGLILTLEETWYAKSRESIPLPSHELRCWVPGRMPQSGQHIFRSSVH